MKSPFVLKSIAVENYKAVRNSGTVELTPLTVLIGDNGSGKSSLVEALAAYQDILEKGLDRAFERSHGLAYVLNRSLGPRPVRQGFFEERPPGRFHWKGRWNGGAFDVTMTLALELGGNAGRIQHESLKLAPKRLYRRTDDGRIESFVDGKMERVRRVDRGETAAPQDWRELTRRWQFLALEPRPLGEPARPPLARSAPVLRRDGANLAQYLWSLRDASVETFEGLIEAIKCILPYARDLQPIVTEGIERLVHVEMAEETFKVPGWLLSTGTLRILALLACLRHPDPPPLLIVEEVENGLDPSTMHLLVEEIRAAITEGTTQVILTTHSPYLLDLLDLSHIVVVERRDGQPTFRRPDVKALAEWAKSFTAGQLYTMGRLTQGQK